MGYIILLVFFLLMFSLVLSLVKQGRWYRKVFYFRWLVALFSLGVFAYYFTIKSLSLESGAMSIQIINKLPQPVDFYLIKKENSPENMPTNKVRHLGKIRPEHYRLDYLEMKNSDEYWVVGFIGKKNLVYFTQHTIQNKNIDQIVEINNYLNQSKRLSDKAKKEVEAHQSDLLSFAILVTLALLLLFMNLVLLLKKK